MNTANDSVVPDFDFGVFSEFQKISDKEIDDFISGQKAKTTKYKDTSDTNIFLKFCRTINEFRELHEIPECDLDNILCQFFMKVKTRNGSLYEPDSLTSIRNSLQRVLFDRGSKINLREGKNFEKSRQVLSSRRKQLTKLGKGNKPNATRPLSDEEVDKLYSCNYFGSATPTSLQRTVWWNITKHFGHRARDESRQIKFGDIKIEKDHTLAEYLVWITERSTKTRTGERPMGHQRAFNPKAFSTGTDRCPVEIFKKFVSHRPPTMCEDDSPLFLGVRFNINFETERTWYLTRPLGVNSIGKFLSEASSTLSGGIVSYKGKVANHSARKTSITNLLNKNVNPLHVKQISGHKNLDSLNLYNVASNDQQKYMSRILSDGNNNNNKSVNNNPISNNNPSSTTTSHHINNNNNNMILEPEIQQQMFENWDPVMPATFNGAQISNCTFNINICYNTCSSPPRKRKRVLIIDDSQ